MDPLACLGVPIVWFSQDRHVVELHGRTLELADQRLEEARIPDGVLRGALLTLGRAKGVRSWQLVQG
jgi:hypothetical protein